jgi:hypothetical protein
MRASPSATEETEGIVLGSKEKPGRTFRNKLTNKLKRKKNKKQLEEKRGTCINELNFKLRRILYYTNLKILFTNPKIFKTFHFHFHPFGGEIKSLTLILLALQPGLSYYLEEEYNLPIVF